MTEAKKKRINEENKSTLLPENNAIIEFSFY